MLGENIANIRRSKNISQEQLADALCTSRQAVSKWERGETYPDLDKLKDIATYFGVSIDYLLDFDLSSVSVTNFIERITECIKNKEYSITDEEIRVIVLKNSNNFNLLINAIQYLINYWIINPTDMVASMIVEYGKKALLVYREDNTYGIKLEDIHKAVMHGYQLQDKYDIAKEYIKENKIADCQVTLAECEYRVGNYDDSLAILSDTFLETIGTIINANVLQIRVLLRTNKINDAYELVNWSISFINSVSKKEELLFDIVYALVAFKATCERYLGLDYSNSLEFLKNNINRLDQRNDSSDEIKFYYNQKSDFLIIMRSLKEELYREIEAFKETLIYSDMMAVYQEVFGSEINE